ncbi:MAG: flagellar basal body-associated FliL family protein [Burkholderiaceae bacterium]
MSAAAAVADASPAKKPGGKKKLVVMVAVAAIVLGGGGVGALVYMKKQKAAAEAAAAASEDGDVEAGAPAKAEKKHEKGAKPVFVPMDPFVVNLADHEADRYAQIGITLEVPDEHVGEEIKTYLPAIRNNILLLLAHKSSADLAGGEGKELLAKQIRREALKAMGEEVENEDEPEVAHAAPAEGASAAAVHAKKKKKKKAVEAADTPIRSVQFSSFIIQ